MKSKKSKAPTMKFGRIAVELSNLEKVLIPDGITKGDIITYYDKIADHMVPYMKNRALMMQRFPEGISGEAFYQKDASSYFPSWIKQVLVPKEGGGHNNYVVCQNRATLVYLANQACITSHLWLSRIDKLHNPDHIIFDLDPSAHDFSMIRMIALAIKDLLDTLGLTSFVMTSGSRGLHVYVPIDRKLDFHEVKAFALLCAKVIMHEHPDATTLEIRKEKRGKKVFIDTLRNQFGSTSVAPYSIRPKPHAPIATPLHWHEVESAELGPQSYNIANIFKRLEKIDDPWKDQLEIRQSLKTPQAKLKKLGL